MIPERIPCGDGCELRLDSAGVWSIYRNSAHVRPLNRFENNWVNSAFATVAQRRPIGYLWRVVGTDDEWQFCADPELRDDKNFEIKAVYE